MRRWQRFPLQQLWGAAPAIWGRRGGLTPTASWGVLSTPLTIGPGSSKWSSKMKPMPYCWPLSVIVDWGLRGGALRNLRRLRLGCPPGAAALLWARASWVPAELLWVTQPMQKTAELLRAPRRQRKPLGPLFRKAASFLGEGSCSCPLALGRSSLKDLLQLLFPALLVGPGC